MESSLYISCVSLSCGGAERVLSVLSSHFADKYENVKIFTWKETPVFYDFDTRVQIISIERECSSKNTIQKCFWFRKYIKRNIPDVILSFLAKSSVQVILSTIGLKVPIVVAERNDPRQLKGGWAMIKIRDFLYNRASGILEQTNNNRKYFTGSKYKKTDVIYNPVFMEPDHIGSAVRTNKLKIIISVGRLEKQKNHKLLIDSFAKLHNLYPDYCLVIYGEGAARKELENYISRFSLQKFILLPGNRTNVLDEMKKASMFVLSSNFEGMSNALIEAMCLGLPCISTKVSGSTDLINDGANGLLIDLDDREQLFNAMKRIIEDEEFALSLGMEATKIYSQLNVDKISKEWVHYINRFMSI
mgnify:FL=1